MSAQVWIARVAIVAMLVASLSFEASPAQASGQTISGTILLPSNGGGVARREWNASGGAINGVNGYVFVVDPGSVGTYFTLQLAATNTGTGSLSIAFYTDMVNGITCSSFDGTPNAAGVVCGGHAIVYTLAGANLTFIYQSGMAVPAPAPFVASKFKFSAPMALPFAAGQTQGNIGEPSVDVDPGNGNIYVTSPTGIPCGINPKDECVAFWRSTDGGQTFIQPAPTAFQHPIGGGDSDVTHDGLGNVFISDLRSLVDTGIWRSTDQGNTWAGTETGPCSDREWIAWGGPNASTGPLTIYLTQNSGVCFDGLLQFWRSVDDGLTWLPTGFVDTDLHQLGYAVNTASGGAVEAKLAVDLVTGTIYVAWATDAIEDATNAQTRLLLVGRSTDGGATWSNRLVYHGPPGTSIQNLFPVIAVDHGGNVYAAFSTQLSGSLMGVYLATSTDRGDTWSAVQRVNPADQTAVFPAIAAGDTGKVDLIWIGTPAPAVNDPSAQWNIFFGQSRNADTPTKAKWSVGQVSTQVMHRGDICNQGLNCNIFGGNRDLADFISVTVDADGFAHAVWTDDASQSPKAIMYAKQIAGPATGKLPPRS